MLAGQQALTASVGDHRTIVGAEARPGIEHLALELAEHRLQRRAQRLVGAHPAGDHQTLQAGLLERPAALDGQRLHHRLLEGQGDVAAGLLDVAALHLALPPGIEGEGLQAAETEVQSRPIGHRPREDEAPRCATLG
ncbi:hypothetical protein D3C81_1846410 [compost metagenome]